MGARGLKPEAPDLSRIELLELVQRLKSVWMPEVKKVENESLNLITPPPEERLLSWLAEFYGKPVRIGRRELLRHRDLSFVERLWIVDGLPDTLIYKVVLPPWDIEQDLHERVLIPSICNSAQLYMTAHLGQHTAMFLEDLGSESLKEQGSSEIASQFGKELAKMHRAYSYRTDELLQIGVLPTLFPIDYEEFTGQLAENVHEWGLIDQEEGQEIVLLAGKLAHKLAGEPISLVHGDLYAENLILRNDRFFIIDWSWFTLLGVPLMDLGTVTMDHYKNGKFTRFADVIIDAYCFESGRQLDDVKAALPVARILSRLLFFYWLVERRQRGIIGTTVGPVDGLIPKVTAELRGYLKAL